MRVKHRPPSVVNTTPSNIPAYHYDRPSAHRYREAERLRLSRGLVRVRDLIPAALIDLLEGRADR